MLAKAQGREVSTRNSSKAELTAYLADHPEAFDLIVSADTLVYFGALEPVLDAAFRALRPGGLLIFTVEEADERPRRAAIASIRTAATATVEPTSTVLCTAAGFTVLAMESAVLRTEGGSPVAGLVVTGRKGEGSDTPTDPGL